MALRLSREMRSALLDKLETMFPVSLEIYGTILSINPCDVDETEIWVDGWPEVQGVLVCPATGKGAPIMDDIHKIFAANVHTAQRLLKRTMIFERRSRIGIFGIRQLLWPVIEDSVASVGLHSRVICNLQLLYLPHKTVIPECPPLPPGYKMSCLQTSHAATINKAWWVQSGQRTEEYLRSLIENYPNVAVFQDDTRDLVAWMISYDYGAIGHLFVLPNHRRKNLGTICLLSLSVILRENGRVPYVLIVPDNAISLEFHRKHGFVDGDEQLQYLICSKDKDNLNF